MTDQTDKTTATDQISDVVGSAKQKSQEQAGEMVKKGGGAVRSQIDQRSTQAGQQAQSAADTLRQTATQLRSEGDPQKARFAQAADSGAEQLDRIGAYLSQADADELIGKLDDFGRRQPYLIAGAGLLLGIAAGRFIKSSSHGRYYRPPTTPRERPAQEWETAQLPPAATVSPPMSGSVMA
jgi:hypothetical protein